MFRATFIFGPLQGTWLDMAAPYTPERLWFAPPSTRAGRYRLIGRDDPPEPAWPGQVEYVLDRDRSVLRPHHQYPEMEQGDAVYVLAEQT